MHKQLLYYPSNKFEFGSIEEYSFFAKAWLKSVNRRFVEKMYSEWEDFVKQSSWMSVSESNISDQERAILRALRQCPCNAIVIFNVLRVDAFLGVQNLSFNNRFDLKTNYFHSKISADVERSNIETAHHQLQGVTSLSAYESLLTHLPVSHLSSLSSKEKLSRKSRQDRIAHHLNHELEVERDSAKKYRAAVDAQLSSLVNRGSRAANLAYYAEVARLAKRKLFILQSDATLASDEVNPACVNLKTRKNKLRSSQAFAILIKNTRMYMHKSRCTSYGRSKKECPHTNVSVSWKQTRCNDEIETKIVFCLDCNRTVSR